MPWKVRAIFVPKARIVDEFVTLGVFISFFIPAIYATVISSSSDSNDSFFVHQNFEHCLPPFFVGFNWFCIGASIAEDYFLSVYFGCSQCQLSFQRVLLRWQGHAVQRHFYLLYTRFIRAKDWFLRKVVNKFFLQLLNDKDFRKIWILRSSFKLALPNQDSNMKVKYGLVS